MDTGEYSLPVCTVYSFTVQKGKPVKILLGCIQILKAVTVFN